MAIPSRASFHLAALADTGMISGHRGACEIRYRVEFDKIGALITFLMEDCCGGEYDVPRLL